MYEYRIAGIGSHIRKGVDSDLAYLAPTLIPVPGAFQSDGSNPLVSHTAENTLFEIKKSMILGVSGEYLLCVGSAVVVVSVKMQQEIHCNFHVTY